MRNWSKWLRGAHTISFHSFCTLHNAKKGRSSLHTHCDNHTDIANMNIPTQSSAAVAPAASGSGPSGPRQARIAAHSHIRGLGLDDAGNALPAAQGFVGQKAAREVRKREQDSKR